MEKRISYIDFLKVVALSGIIIAHVGSPNWLMMARSFDVPLMVIISSLLASYSIKKYKNDYRQIIKYYISRVKRLVFPTYIFLFFYFIIRIVISKEIQSVKYYLATFLLTRYGFGYVWIILIYLYSAFLIPIYRKIGYNFKSISLVLIIYFAYELLYFFGIGINNKIVDTTLFYIIPYGLLTFIGYNIEKMSNKQKHFLIAINLTIFVLLAYYYFIKTGSFQLVQISKYPPRIYYLSYGILCSILFICFCNKNEFKIFENKIILYISKHSMWIYLWHILILDIYKYFKLPELWYIKVFFVYFIAVLVVFITNKTLDIIEKKRTYSLSKYLR